MFGWFRSLFSSTPAWLAPLGDRGEAFVAVLGEALEARGLSLDPATGQARLPEGGLGFANLARECAQTDPSDWPAQIGGWLEAALAPPADLSSFEGCQAQLRMKMFVEPPPDFEEGVTGEAFGPLFAAVCVDTPTTITSVPAETLRSWGVDYATLRRTALDNFAASEEVARQTVDLGDGVQVEECVGDAYCVCGSALALAPEGMGMLVSIPTRHHVLTHAVTGAASLGALSAMARFGVELVASAPGALTASVVWLRPDAEPVHIHVGMTPDGGPMVVAPPELEALLAAD